MTTRDKGKTSRDILIEIRDTLKEGNASIGSIRNNTRTIRQDVSGIREGRTGADSRLKEDPLTPAERAQVDEVKHRYREYCKKTPHYSLFSVAKEVRRDRLTAGYSEFYESDLALNHRAYIEIKREDRGLPPF